MQGLAYTGRSEELIAAVEWARAVCHMAFGEREGEARFRSLPAKFILRAWTQRAQA